MQHYLEIDGRTYYAFEEPDFIGPLSSEKPARPITSECAIPTLDSYSKPKSRKFAWAFGVVMPVICFMFDPGVFASDGHGRGLLGAAAGFSYVLSFAAIMGTMAWLIWGERLGNLLPFLSGLLAVSAVCSLIIGLILFPFSMMGLAFLIGALGFTPLLSSAVFFRASVNAFQSRPASADRLTAWHSFMLGALVAIVLPLLANRYF